MKKLIVIISFVFIVLTGCYHYQDPCCNKDYILFNLLQYQLEHQILEYCINATCCYHNTYCNIYGCYDTIECY